MILDSKEFYFNLPFNFFSNFVIQRASLLKDLYYNNNIFEVLSNIQRSVKIFPILIIIKNFVVNIWPIDSSGKVTIQCVFRSRIARWDIYQYFRILWTKGQNYFYQFLCWGFTKEFGVFKCSFNNFHWSNSIRCYWFWPSGSLSHCPCVLYQWIWRWKNVQMKSTASKDLVFIMPKILMVLRKKLRTKELHLSMIICMLNEI